MKKSILENFSPNEREILRKRAEKVANSNIINYKQGEEYLICRISDEYYGFETKHMQEVFFVDHITPLPSTPDWLLGIINARGEIISVIDMKNFFELKKLTPKNKFKVLILHKEEMKFGILIDAIHDLVNLKRDELTTDFITFDKIRKDYLLGLTDKNYVILDAEKILNDPKLIISQEN